MYKVGDEVLVKGEVVEVMSGVPYPTKVRLGKGEDVYLFSNDEICFADKIVKTYEMGLNDAWELAKKIRVQPSNGGIPISELEEIFGTTFIDTIFKNNTYEEALDKIEAYEKKKEIKEGMIVVFSGERWIVAEIKEDILKLWNGKEILEARKSSCEPTKGVIEVSIVLGR